MAEFAFVQARGNQISMDVVPVVGEQQIRVEFDITKLTRDFVEGAIGEMLEEISFAVKQSLAVGALENGIEALLIFQVVVEIWNSFRAMHALVPK